MNKAYIYKENTWHISATCLKLYYLLRTLTCVSNIQLGFWIASQNTCQYKQIQVGPQVSCVMSSLTCIALKTMHAQVVDRMLQCLTLNHRWDIKSGQFNGYVDTVMLAKDIDEIMDSLHST